MLEQGEWAETVNERDPADWDWQDEQYFMLGPFFGISTEQYLDMSYIRCGRYIEEINDRLSDGSNASLSLHEHSMYRVAAAFRGPAS